MPPCAPALLSSILERGAALTESEIFAIAVRRDMRLTLEAAPAETRTQLTLNVRPPLTSPSGYSVRRITP